MRAGLGLVGLLLAVLLVIWLAKPSRVLPPSVPSATSPPVPLPVPAGPQASTEEFRQALDAAMQARQVPEEAR